MHVEIEHGDAFQAVGLQRVRRAHGDVVVQAKTQQAVALGDDLFDPIDFEE